MLRRLVALSLVCLVLALVGCRPREDAPLPTLISTSAPLPTQTPAPTQAPQSQPTQSPAERPTLPPTWTPPVAPTDTLLPATETLPPTAPAALPTLAVCATFRADLAKFKPEFKVGNSIEVFWTPTDTAIGYRVALIDDKGQETFSDLTADTKYTFRADLFTRGLSYGWSVYPVSSIGQQMCEKRGGELFPQ